MILVVLGAVGVMLGILAEGARTRGAAPRHLIDHVRRSASALGAGGPHRHRPPGVRALLSGLACVVYYRHELLRSAKNFLFIGVAPLVGAGILFYLFAKSVIDLSNPENSYTGQTWLGVGPPLVIGLGFLLLGVVLLGLWRLGGHERYFGRRPFEIVDPEVAAGRVRIVTEEV